MSRRLQYLAATALAPNPVRGRCPGLSLAAPIALSLAPSGASAANININGSCKLSGNASQLCLASGIAVGDTVSFNGGGVLTMDTVGKTLSNSPTVSNTGA